EPDNDIVLGDPNVSRHHGELRHGPGGWEYYDLQSSQGSFVDGRKVPTVPIKGAISIVLGVPPRGVALDFVVSSEDATTVAPSGPTPATALVGGPAPSPAPGPGVPPPGGPIGPPSGGPMGGPGMPPGGPSIPPG